MSQPPYHPGGNYPPAPGTISVGGPQGIQVQGTQIHIGGVAMGPPPGYPGGMQPVHLQQPMPPYGHAVPMAPSMTTPGMEQGPSQTAAQANNLRAAVSLAGKNPLAMAAATGAGAVLALVTSIVAFAFLGLPPVLIIVPLTLAVGMFIAAGWFLKRARTQIRVTPLSLDRSMEPRLVEAARASAGRITIPAAATTLGITLAEAEGTLTSLVREGYITMETDSATGTTVYVFPVHSQTPSSSGWQPPTR